MRDAAFVGYMTFALGFGYLMDVIKLPHTLGNAIAVIGILGGLFLIVTQVLFGEKK